ILSLVGNCLLLLVAFHKRSTLKPAEFFIINLSISDLGMTLSLFPLAIPSAFSHRWLFGEITCQLYAMCGVLFGLCSLTNLTALSLVCCLKVCFPTYVFCYALPCTIIFLSYSFILLTVRGSRQAVQQHVSPQTKTTNAHALIVKRSPQLSIAVCIGFLGAWTPYAVVAMWAAFGDATAVPPVAFALAAVFAKSSTIYNPMVYLLCKPNFRECLCRDTSTLRQMI
uniref:Opsin 7, group member c n=1 Tax=Poecilia formosa TaxID=48698 RepID=A0A087XFT9_POEFO